MHRTFHALLIFAIGLSGVCAAGQSGTVDCKVSGFKAKNHRALQPVPTPTDGACHAGKKDGFPIPDPHCTPGAFNPTVTVDILNASGHFRTGCVRNKVESEDAKHVAYKWYGIPAPENNTGATQVCELDHLVPLELGGGDSMDNIWPQCGPNKAVLNNRYFKKKDLVEFYLAGQVKGGAMDLATAQKAIAADYTQFLQKAAEYCKTHHCG